MASTPKVLDPRRRALVMALHVMCEIAYLPLKWWPRGRPPPLADAPRLLLVRVDGVGDFMMTTALFPSLRAAFPGATIDLVCSTLAAPLARRFVETGAVQHLYPLPLKWPGWPQLRRLIAQLRANHYDAAADLRGDFRGVLLAWMTGAPRRYGLGYSGFDFLLTETLPAEQVHQVEEVARSAQRMGAPRPPHGPKFPISLADATWVTTWLGTEGWDGHRPLVAFHLSAGTPARLWPLERFIMVAERLHQQFNAQPVVIGSPSDNAQAEAFKAALPSVDALIAAGQMSLPRTTALMQRCALFIGTDSGPAHMAAAVDCPVIVLFGPGNLTVMRPFGEDVSVLQSPQACDVDCHNKTCAVPERHCLKAISVEDVTRAAAGVLSRRVGAQTSGL